MSYNILGGFDNFLGGLIVGSGDSDEDNKSNDSNQSGKSNDSNQSKVSSYLDSEQSDNKSNHSNKSNVSKHSNKSNHSKHSNKSNHFEEELFSSEYTKEDKKGTNDLIEYIPKKDVHDAEREDNISIDEHKKHEKKKKPKNINTSPKSPHSMGSAFSSPNTPIKHSGPNSPIKHSGPNTPIKHSGPNSPINNSTPNTPSSDKSIDITSPKSNHKKLKHQKHKKKNNKTNKHEKTKHKKNKGKELLHPTVDSDTELPSTSEFVDEDHSIGKLEKMIADESKPAEPTEHIDEQSMFTEQDRELNIVDLNTNKKAEESLDSEDLVFGKKGGDESPFAILGGYINSTFST